MIDFDQADAVVDFDSANQGLDDLIGGIQGTPGTAGDYAAQAGRGVLGFAKDIVMGVGELAYEGVKGVGKLGQRTTMQGGMLTQVDAQILAENIRLGNVSGGTVWQGAKNVGSALVKPITEPWGKGQYVESVTRGLAEAATLPVAWLKSTKLARLGKLGEATKAAEAAKAAELAKAAEAAKAARAAEAAKAAELAKAEKAAEGGKVKGPGVHIKAATGERAAHDAMVGKGHEPLGKTDGNYKPGQNGIDGVYKNPNPPPDYIITEAKYGTSKLSKGLAEGTNQMDDAWVKRRLTDAVGKEQADLTRESMNNGGVEKWLLHVDEAGKVTASRIDDAGKIIRGNAGKIPGF